MAIYSDILQQTHTIIGGRTGAGKSVVLSGIMAEIAKTEYLFYLVDPKKVELYRYSFLSGCCGYAENMPEISGILQEVIAIMDQRYTYMKDNFLTKYDGIHIFVIIDELSDLMLCGDKTIKNALQKLLQLARAANIHIIAATQQPARKVLPAELQLNFTCILALQCRTATESRQLIGKPGAESLPAHGKGYFITPNSEKLVDIPYIDFIPEKPEKITAKTDSKTTIFYKPEKITAKPKKHIDITSMIGWVCFISFLLWLIH